MGWTDFDLENIHLSPLIRTKPSAYPLWNLLLEHEMGHGLGLGHVYGNNLMNPKLISNLLTRGQKDDVRHDWARMHTGGEVPAMLQSGEFVMQRDAVRRIGTDTLAAMNSGTLSNKEIRDILFDIREALKEESKKADHRHLNPSPVRGELEMRGYGDKVKALIRSEVTPTAIDRMLAREVGRRSR